MCWHVTNSGDNTEFLLLMKTVQYTRKLSILSNIETFQSQSSPNCLRCVNFFPRFGGPAKTRTPFQHV